MVRLPLSSDAFTPHFREIWPASIPAREQQSQDPIIFFRVPSSLSRTPFGHICPTSPLTPLVSPPPSPH